MSSAWPVPKATTFTSSPLAFLKAGNKCANKPDCSVEVVDDITIDWACAHTEVLAKTAHTRARRVNEMGRVMKALLEQKRGLPGCTQPAGWG